MRIVALAAPLCLALCAPGFAQSTPADAPRSAHGDLTQPGGARRLSGDSSASYRALAAADDAKVRNVILFIGDGMGDSEITMARNYAEGAGGFFKGIDALPVTGQYTHYSLDKATGRPVYVTDSAASGTAWAIGTKTSNGAIGVDIHGRPHPSLIELAKAAGIATGDVTTAEIEDATPAVEVAHVIDRECYGPVETTKTCPENALQNGGAGSIAEQLLDVRPDLALGGGAKTFAEQAMAGKWQGKTLLEQARARGFRVVTDAAGVAAVHAANQQAPLLGLFAEGDLAVRWNGPRASYHGNIDRPPVTCADNPERPAGQPRLAAMTAKAIELLSAHPKGFFLQVEGASIDKQSHAANPCGEIGEVVDLDEAVQVALAFARKDARTLVIVTADHAHAGQIIYADAKAPGLTEALTTKDGAVMAVSYGNSEGSSMGHTGTQLRVAGYGPHAFDFAGLTDQTDMFYTIRDALGLKGS
ncbi:MAG TPA: alkaline phosphatase [Sphingomonadaceae bacterium]